MEKNKLVALGVVAIIAILLFAGFQNGVIQLFGTNDYGTGLSISTTAKYVPQLKTEEYQKGQTWLSQPTETVAGLPINREPFVKNKYIVSWMPNELSELITLRADFNYNFLPMGVGPNAMYGHVATMLLSCYFVTVKYVDITGKETKIIDTKDGVNTNHDLWDTNYIEVIKERFPPDSRRVADQGYRFPGVVYAKAQGQGMSIFERIGRDATVEPMTFANSYYRVGWDFSDPSWYKTPVVTMPTDTLEFHMKGLRTGVLKVSYGVTCAYLQQDGLVGWHGTWHYKVVNDVLTDACYLASGAGDINVKSTGFIPLSPLQESEQKEMKDSTGKTTWGGWYTKYVFPESNATFESKVVLGVKTGYSGQALNPGDDGYKDPWTIAIYNGLGKQVNTITVPDNYNGDISYTIPKNAFVAGGNNEWKVVLKNTLFDEAEVVLFVVDSLNKIPGPVIPSVDKTSYTEGDSVILSLSAMANPKGSGQITQFYVDVKYTSTSSTKHVTGFPKYISATKKAGTNYTYTAVYTFKLDNTTPVVAEGAVDAIYIRAHAIDKDGRAGVEGEINGLNVKQRVPENNGVNLEFLTGDMLVLLGVIALIVILAIASFYILYRQGRLGQFRFGKGRRGK